MKHISIQAKILYCIALIWTLLLFSSLIWGFLNPFFWWENQQGIDYFALPRGFLNLLQGKSIFDTFNGVPFGPRATWYLAHPIFEILIAPWFSFISPWKSYALFQLCSYTTLAYAAYLLTKHAEHHIQKASIYCFMLVAFPVYWLLYVGNMHAPLVLSITLILSGLLSLDVNKAKASNKIIAGLLLSLFTKPLVIIMLPAFILYKTTRLKTIYALLAYGAVSLLCVIIPYFNPQGVGLSKIIPLFFQPELVKAQYNVYVNNFQLKDVMLDNSIHWLNLIAQSDFYWNFVQIFSLSAFLNSIIGTELPSIIYKLPLFVAVITSLSFVMVKDANTQQRIVLFSMISLSLTLFLSYNTIWEYQFTSALPVIALSYILYNKAIISKKEWVFCLINGLFLMLPTPFILFGSVNNIQASDFTFLRFNRTLPVLFLYVFYISKTIGYIVGNLKKKA